MELVNYKYKIVDNMLIITPEEGFKDNSVYDLNFNGVMSENDEELKTKISLCTKLEPLYVDLIAVKTLIRDIDIDDFTILYNIREASKYAQYLSEDEIDDNNIPFEVSQFVRYKATYECLLAHMVNLSKASGISGTVGEVTFAEKETNKDISKLLEQLDALVKKWTDDVKGYKNEGRAKMQVAVKSSHYIDSSFGNNAPMPAFNSPGINMNRGI